MEDSALNLDRMVKDIRTALEPLIGKPVDHQAIQDIVTEMLPKIVGSETFPFDENDIIVTQEHDVCHVEYSPRLSAWIREMSALNQKD